MNKNNNNIIKFNPDYLKQNDSTESSNKENNENINQINDLKKEEVIKELLVNQGYAMLKMAFDVDGIEPESVYKILDLENEFKQIPLQIVFENNRKSFVMFMFRLFMINEAEDITYVVYTDKDPYTVGVIKKVVNEKGKTTILEFNRNNNEWESVEDSPLLEIKTGIFEKNDKEFEKVDSGTFKIIEMIAFDNATQKKFGITKEQLNMAKKLGKIYNQNMGILQPIMHDEKILLVPLDINWKGLAISVDDNGDLTPYLFLLTKEIKNDGEKIENNNKIFYKLKNIKYPIEMVNKTVSAINRLIKKSLKEREGKIYATTIPISENLVITSVSTKTDQVLKEIEEQKDDTTKEENKIITDIIKIFEKFKEEEII